MAVKAEKKLLQRVGESRLAYVRRARRYAKRAEARLLASGEYDRCHRSFLVRDALLEVERVYSDLGTFGVEYVAAGSNRRSPAIDYLNTGDGYELTVCHVRGRYVVAAWADFVERGNYS